MGDRVEHDLTDGRLVFITNDGEPLPLWPEGWLATAHPIQVDRMEHDAKCQKKGVGCDPLGKPSIRKVTVVYDAKRWRMAQAFDGDFIEVYRNNLFGMVLGVVPL